jgi:uncharacterized BrkB/YihY/UPF0761 family membrane protein
MSKRAIDAVKYYALGLWNGIDDDHCFLFASGIAYNVILCLIPLSLIMFQVLTFIFRDNIDAQAVVLGYIRKSLPVEGYGSTIEEWVSGQFSHVIDLALIPAIIGSRVRSSPHFGLRSMRSSTTSRNKTWLS